MTQTINTPLSLTLLLLIVASVAPAAAQTASSFEQLAPVLESGDRVTVTDSIGRTRTGQVIDLSPSALALLIDGKRYRYREAQVHTVRQWQPDSLRNGALFGFAVGAALGATALDPQADITGGPLAFALSAVAGMGIGMGIDAATVSGQIVYQSTGIARRVTVAPLLARNRRGLAVSFGF